MKRLLKSEVKMYNGRPTVFINDRAYSPVIYSLTDCPGGRLSYEEFTGHSISRFVKMGFRLFQLDIWLDDMWYEDGTFDISMAQKQIKGVTEKCPDAAVFLRFHTTPPKWWNRLYPDEMVDYADTPAVPEESTPEFLRYLINDLKPLKKHSFASEKWLSDSTKMLIRFLNELSETDEAASLAGIQPATGVYGEHHYWAFMGHEPDTGKAMQKAFSKFLSDKYGSDKNLRKAWNDDTVSISGNLVPGMDKRSNNTLGFFRDPSKERCIIDYYECQHTLVADCVVHFCRTIKENWPGEIITGAFYGYYISVFGRMAAGGHLCEQKILQSEYIDCLCAPQAYDGNLRQVGGAGASRGMLESAMLHKKLWLDEMDQPVHTGTVMGGMPVYPVYESKQILRRNTMYPIVKGGGLWYYDFGPHNHSGWWTHKVYEDEIESLKGTIDAMMEKDYENPADVLLVFDTSVFKYTGLNSRKDPITDAACINLAFPLSLRSGAATDTIYLSDLENADLGRYKCVVFFNTFLIDDEKREFIKTRVMNDGRHTLWFHAPGYLDGMSADIENIAELLGKPFDETTIKGAPSARFGNETIKLQNLYEKLYKSPGDFPETRIFHPSGGKYNKVVRWEGDNHTVWFSPLPFDKPDHFRNVFEKAGVHIYSDGNDSVTCGSGVLSLHTENGGTRTVCLKNGISIDIELKPAETILLDDKTGEILARD